MTRPLDPDFVADGNGTRVAVVDADALVALTAKLYAAEQERDELREDRDAWQDGYVRMETAYYDTKRQLFAAEQVVEAARTVLGRFGADGSGSYRVNREIEALRSALATYDNGGN